MTKKFCDRCGKEIKPRDDMTLVAIKTIRSSYDNYYDLCIECLEKICECLKGESCVVK